MNILKTEKKNFTDTGPSGCDKNCFLSKFFLKIINEFEKTDFYSPSLHQDVDQNLFNCFRNYIPINIITLF